MKDWLYTIRWKNLLIIWISILVVILPHFDLVQPRMFFEFILWAAICSSIAAIGNITNDLLDVKQDRENKKKNIFADGKNRKTGYVIILLLLLLCIWAIISSNNKTWFWGLAGISLLSLLSYNLFLKKIALVGNLVIALLTALIFIGIDLIVLNRVVYFEFGFENKQLELLAGFAFLTTVVREILKDAEDRKGDSFAGFKTVAKYLNDKWISLLIILIGMAGCWGIYTMISGRHLHFIDSYFWYTGWTLCVTMSSAIIMMIPHPSKYVRATRIVKAGMLGCLGIYLYLSL